MKKLPVLLFLLLLLNSTKAQLSFSEQSVDLGTIPEASEISGSLIIRNASAKKAFLMRADADHGVKVYTSKKTLNGGDTCLITISFVPESSGKFRKKIELISSDKATPYEISLAGNLSHLKPDDKTACYYFGSRKPSPVAVNTQPLVIPENNSGRDNSNRLPEHTQTETPPPVTRPGPTVTQSTAPPATRPQPTVAPQNDFSETAYRPNNILFLVDVSSSMKDSLKLPLMKRALHTLINSARHIDTITFITYASKVVIMKEAVSGADKPTLHTVVDSLKAKGMTAGHQAILFSQQIAQKHFITGGNNQIILATDGEFKFTSEDEQLWKARQQDKKIVLTTVAFGNEKAAIKNLKNIASKGEGSFIHIEHGAGSEQKLLNEIKQRSRK